ncbi:MAG: toll/interleukin-1 receptor domain-containing protein [Alphaproteobacteria bacterium]|nr:toll/interleukin-1 receptor domain-containing protein [Alphaproteobacteria bacterium]
MAKAVGRKPKRVSSIRVDDGELDLSSLDAFIATTRVFPSFSHSDRDLVRPYLDELAARGFEVFNDLETLVPGDNFAAVIENELRRAAKNGWVVAFLTHRSLQSAWVQQEIEFAMQLGAKFVPVLIDPGLSISALPAPIGSIHVLNTIDDPATGPARLADALHQLAPS